MTDSIATYLRGHRARVARERRLRRARYERARAQAEAMVVALVERYPVTRVWLFGSILDPGRFDERSDIDVACEGLPPERYLEAFGVLESTGPLPFDLVRVESCSPTLAARIRREGELVHGDP
ncbi:MAG: nucleotidyltransferase domain-containing protein [Bacillota bacterium]